MKFGIIKAIHAMPHESRKIASDELGAIHKGIRSMSSKILIPIIICALFALKSSLAEEENLGDSAQVSQGVYLAPSAIDGTLNWIPYFPGSALKKGQVGYVSVGFMVDKNGQPHEPLILITTNALFNEAAIKGVLSAKFKPATFDGVSVDSYFTIKVFFDDPNRKHNIRRKTSSLLRAFKKEIEKEDADAKIAAALLVEMSNAEKVNFAFSFSLSLSRLQYALRFGSRPDQIAAYREVLLFGKSTSAFAAELVGLLIEEGYYGEALQYYETYLSKVDPESKGKTLKAIQAPIQQIKNIQSSDQAIARSVNLNKYGTIHLPLTKSSFALDSVSGEINTLKLRCERRFAELSFNLDSDYQIPESWGRCNLEIIGGSGSTARLIQL